MPVDVSVNFLNREYRLYNAFRKHFGLLVEFI